MSTKLNILKYSNMYSNRHKIILKEFLKNSYRISNLNLFAVKHEREKFIEN
jgi:hypothetical protein